MNKIIIIILSVIGFIFLSGVIYYYNFGDRGNVKKYIKCMCDKFENGKITDTNTEQIQRGICRNKINSTLAPATLAKRYPDLWKKYDECKTF
jgi:hypothetical protein